MKISLIIPVYNAEKTLPATLESIRAQRFRDFEVICFVEESTDRSLAICRAMSERDSRFQVATGPKSGSGGPSRNYGIDHASGEYIVFVDGDDWIVEDMLEKLFEKLQQTGSLDILAFACVTTQSEDVDLSTAPKHTNFTAQDANEVFSGPDGIRRSCRRNKGQFFGYSVLNLYRTAFLLENHLYQPGGVLEDFTWMMRVWFYAKRMAYLDEVFYVYRRRPDSLTTEDRSRVHIMQTLAEKVFPTLFEFACTESIPEDILSIWSNLWFSMLYWYLFHPITSKNTSDKDRESALKTLLDGKGLAYFKQLVSYASFPKRLAAPFVLLAANNFQLPAKIFFRKIYYPMIEQRKKA